MEKLYTITKIEEIDNLPQASGDYWSGFNYIIQYDNGSMKVGETQGIKTRLRLLIQEEARYGIGFIKILVTPEHDLYHQYGSDLKQAAKRMYPIAPSRDYFLTDSIDEIEKYMRNVDYPTGDIMAFKSSASKITVPKEISTARGVWEMNKRIIKWVKHTL